MAGKRVPVRPVAKGGRQVRAESRGAPARESAFSGRKSLIFAAHGGREDGSVANSSFGLMESHRLRQRRKPHSWRDSGARRAGSATTRASPPVARSGPSR